MNARGVRRAWLAVLAALLAYGVTGIFCYHDVRLSVWLDKGATIALAFACVLFVAVYTVLGLRGRAKWWRNDIGMTLVIKTLCLAVALVPLIIAEFFTLSLLADEIAVWVITGALGTAAFMIFWRSWIWLRIAATEDEETG